MTSPQKWLLVMWFLVLFNAVSVFANVVTAVTHNSPINIVVAVFGVVAIGFLWWCIGILNEAHLRIVYQELREADDQ